MSPRLRSPQSAPPAKSSARSKKTKATVGAVPPEELKQEFSPIKLPIHPPYPPMEAHSVAEIPHEEGWLYEPKWDGFRCLAFRRGDQVLLQSKSGQPLGRYFPELVEALRRLPVQEFVIDGEITILVDGHLAFDDLLQRIHPAESRIRKLSVETPGTLMVFDLLVDIEGKPLVNFPLADRREQLRGFFETIGNNDRVRLSPASPDYDDAVEWMSELGAAGLDGIIAKRLDEPYRSGERAGMVKIKRIRTADCVVGGFRYAEKGDKIGSLLLGLYNDEGLLDHVGFTSSFAAEEREGLKSIVEPLTGGRGFTGKAPGGPSRWSTRRSSEWQPLETQLVCEVRYDHFSGDRFRHGTKFLRWRPDKDPKQCTFAQVRGGLKPGAGLKDLFGNRAA
jgi:ATP-dependent DNA ligase